jgi:hypothetical protein
MMKSFGPRSSRGSAALAAAVAIAAVAAAGCSERRAENAFLRAVAEESHGAPSRAREAFRQIAERWPRSAAAARARLEIEWLDELEAGSKRGQALRVWDAVRQVGRAAELFRLSHRRFPDRFDEMVPEWLPGGVLDPWGHAVEYRRTAGGYQAISYGADGIPGGNGDDADILVENSHLRPIGDSATR